MSQLHLFLCRHAPREGSKDQITDVGKQQASALGEALRRSSPKGNVIGMCSQYLRTRETVVAILAGAGCSEASIIQDAALQNTEFNPRWLQAEITSPNAACNAYLQFGDTRPDGHALAPREVAARLVYLFHRHLDDTPSPLTLVAVTHSGMIEVLLAYLLDFQQVEAIGGIFDYLEGITLLFEQAQGAPWSMQASFRSHTYTIADNTLQSLLQLGSMIGSTASHDGGTIS